MMRELIMAIIEVILRFASRFTLQWVEARLA